jgi:hypothetical protein
VDPRGLAPPLGPAGPRGAPPPFLPDARPQPIPHAVAAAAGAHRFGEQVEARCLRPGVAELAEIGIDTPDLPLLQRPPDLAPRRMGRAPLAVPNGPIAARRLTDRCHPLDERLLADPLHHPRAA